MYELLETEIYLLVSYPQLFGEFKKNPENLDISIPYHQGLIADRIDEWMTTCQDILRIFDRLGSNPGFETILCTASTNILKRLVLHKDIMIYFQILLFYFRSSLFNFRI